MAEHNLATVRDIEREISNIDEKLHGKTIAEQERIIHEDRDTIMTLITLRFSFIGRGITYLIGKITALLGFDPLAWLSFNEYDHNAKLADKASSDPNLWNALSKACEIFEQNKGSSQPSPYLNKKSWHMKKELKSVTDSNDFADAIIAFCRIVKTGYEAKQGMMPDVILDSNDLKIVLAAIIKGILSSADTKVKINENYASPILKQGCYGYIKYTFASDYHIQESCCSTYKFVEATITVVSFMFPNESSFRAALGEMEV